MKEQNEFTITIDKFYQGFSPLAFLNDKTELGGAGSASSMLNCDCLGDVLTQGPGIANLTNGTQAGVVTELINFIMDKAVANDVAYGIGTSKLFKISSTAVISDATFPHAITGCVDGQSIQNLKGTLFYFYNKASVGEIGAYDLASTFTDNWGSNRKKVDQITLTGTQGTASITLAGGLTKTITFATDLTATATAFVVANATAYLAQGIVLTSSVYKLIFTANVAGVSFTTPVITNATGDLAGNVAHSIIPELEKAIHPSACKEDLMVFGNGQYVGLYIKATNSLNSRMLDFGSDCVVADVLYNNGYWYLAVNSGVSGTNRTEGQIFLWNGSGVDSTLADEAGVGMQRIGFMYRVNGKIFIAYQDLSSTGFIIGYINGSVIEPLVRFTGTLPTFNQKTLYKNTILFLSNAMCYSAGAMIGDLPYQLSQIADGGYATVGAIACPFGVPLCASNETTNFKLAKFSGYAVDSFWRSITIPVEGAKNKGIIDKITVLSNALGVGALCSLTIEANQAVDTSNVLTISGTGKTRHEITNIGIGSIEDIRVKLDWTGGSATNPCEIRKIIISGHFTEN